MCEIHEAIGPMGNLTSYNILVDRRWTCRVSDYGLEKFKADSHHMKPYEPTETEKYKCKTTTLFISFLPSLNAELAIFITLNVHSVSASC